MKFKSIANKIKYYAAAPQQDMEILTSESVFLSGWFVSIFFICVVAAGILLFPKKSLYHTLLKIDDGQPAALFYLSHYEALYPNDTALHIARAKQAIYLEKYDTANTEIDWLNSQSRFSTEVKILQFQMKYYQAYRLSFGAERNQAISKLKTPLIELTTLSIDDNQLFQLAKNALEIGMPDVAIKFYQHIKNMTDPKSLRAIGVIALQSSQYHLSAQYYMLASTYEKSLENKRLDIISALKGLEAGNLFAEGLTIIQGLPDNIINNKKMLLYLAQYALAANRPDLAQVYAKRALLMRGTVK